MLAMAKWLFPELPLRKLSPPVPPLYLANMLRSMAAQAAAERKRIKRGEATAHSRTQAVALLEHKLIQSKVVRQSGVSRATVDRLYHAVQTKKEALQRNLLNPAMNRARRKPIISTEESVLIEDRIKYAAKHGFAITVEDMKSVIYQIASDGRKTFRSETGLPSADAMRHWRAVNRDVTYRNSENKDAAKLQAENYFHVATFATALQNVGRDFPGIFQNPYRLWNLDETAVLCEYGKKIKVFGAADTHHGGFAACHASNINKHITAVLAVSTSGLKAPPFFIVAGKNVMSSWLKPVNQDEIVEDIPSLAWLTNKKWWAEGAVIMTSENGSMEKRLIKYVVEHVDRFVRKFVSAEEAYCLTLDGHSSREGYEWLEQC